MSQRIPGRSLKRSSDVYGVCALWDVETGTMQQAFDLGQPLSDVAYGPNRLLAVAGENGDCFLLDTRQSKDVAVFSPAERVRGPARIAWGARVNSVLAVASGKGGVGKSSVCVNLAFTMQRHLGLKVGILDADIYGPSLPSMVPASVAEKVYASEAGGIIPLHFEGAPLMSMGFLRPADYAAVRGPMVSAMVGQMLTTTEWGELDVLLVDMPPGTGDIHLTVAQQARIDAAIVVTTPQQLSLIDVEKGIRMFDKVKIPTVAIVENMSFFVCDGCSKRHEIFQRGSGEKLAKDFGIERFFRLPLNPALSSAGMPFVLAESTGDIVAEFQRLAEGAQRAVQDMKDEQPQLQMEVQGAVLVLQRAGEQPVALAAREVLLECRSAKMRDEMTGERLFRDQDIPKNVRATKVETAGRYAVYIEWSNKHHSLFPFDLLGEIFGQGQIWHGADSDDEKKPTAHRPDMLAVSWQGEAALALYSGCLRTKATPRVVKSSSSSTIASLQWSHAYPQLLACAREDGDVEVWHFPENLELAAAATAPAYRWAPRGRGACCTALAMSPEVRPGCHALILSTMAPGQATPLGQTAGAGGALWIVAMPQPHLARAGRVGFFRGGDGDTPKKSEVKSGVLERGVGCKPRNMCVCHTHMYCVYVLYIYIYNYIYIHIYVCILIYIYIILN
ncbi:unnamed protein product [Effrenium voratum]|uniref:Gamma-butyrobetaine hydroxylase-like N-terminal domain-containing protein n=1 Tax=Effrenium voratum TaxID=2562239 RepID=A0AA36HZ90_9DINO|nr:unnamed protein product [Effrenium voratum]